MFQTFSGSSRRPRQVNLSGQNLDPFASTSWAPEASGTKKTLAAAQQEREKRHQERERLQATKRLQRVWRGHRVRKALAESQRTAWDDMEMRLGTQIQCSPAVLAHQSRLLIAFFDSTKPQDILRCNRLSERLLLCGIHNPELRAAISPYQKRLADMALISVAHSSNLNAVADSQLRLLSALYTPNQRTQDELTKYFTTLASLWKSDSSDPPPSEWWEAIAAPLSLTEENGWRGNLAAYAGLAFALLTRSTLSEDINVLAGLASVTDVHVLSQAMLQDEVVALVGSMKPEKRLWLLSHFIYLHNFRSKQSQEPTYIKALSIILSFSANDIFARIETSPGDASDDLDDEAEGRPRPRPLPEFVKSQVISLVNKSSITSLLAKFDADYSQIQSNGPDGDASLLASYALTLLRTFPTLGEEIRMWLYQSSVSLSTRGQVPAVKLFWTIMKSTRIFSSILSDPDSATGILIRTRTSPRRDGDSPARRLQEREWQAILLFLELYSFALRFTDDEEFLSGGQPNVEDPTAYMSRSRESSLPLEDVKLLTGFLKNLSFTTYYNFPTLMKNGYTEATKKTGSLSALFGTTESRRFQPSGQASTLEEDKSTADDYYGSPGMSFDYVRNIVNRVLQMLYERDSRRRFLPPNHWLMTTRINMDGLLPAVVAEEERRQQISHAEEEVDDIDPNDEDFEDVMMPMQRIGNTGHLGVSHERHGMPPQEHRNRASAKVSTWVTPLLEVLEHLPYAIPFKTRVQIFRQFTHQDKMRRRFGIVDPDHWRMRSQQFDDDHHGRHSAVIRRDRAVQDAFNQFYAIGDGLKEPLSITFKDKFGNVEAGIDGGGVTKEFLTTVTKEAFAPASTGIGEFVANDHNLIYPNPAALDMRRRVLEIGGFRDGDFEWHESLNSTLRVYEFLGRVIGKCLYEGILVDIGFAGFFLLKWVAAANSGSGAESRYQANINDLRDLDESLYQNLLKLKNYPGNVKDFNLDFTIEDIVSTPDEQATVTVTRELLPNGGNTPVTNENRVLYISLVARHRLHTQGRLQTNAFLMGLGDMIQPSWLSMFNQIELQTLISGDMAEIDVDDLHANTYYSGVYVIGDDGLEHETIRYFWEVMRELSPADKGAVVRFVTSTPRAPLLGFSALNPRLTIRDSGSDENRLPTAGTCMNLLKLPRYTSKKTLKEKLLYAVHSEAGFDLS